MAVSLAALLEKIESLLRADLIASKESLGTLTLTINANSLLRTLTILRDHEACLFRQLIDITAIDYPDRPHRFDVVYALLSHEHNTRVRVKLTTDAHTLIPSVIGVYKAAGWYEREVFDMFGILFADHPDLRRLLTDYTFSGHPLRKDFPTSGQTEVHYDDEAKQVIYRATP